jgi:hypothetical protein
MQVSSSLVSAFCSPGSTTKRSSLNYESALSKNLIMKLKRPINAHLPAITKIIQQFIFRMFSMSTRVGAFSRRNFLTESGGMNS